MQDSTALGPVESDTLIWESVALRKFRKDSTLARKKCDSLFAASGMKEFCPAGTTPNSVTYEIAPSLFAAHALRPDHFGTVKHADRGEGWLSGILLTILLLAAILNWRYFNRVKTLADAFVLNRFVSQLVREENVFLNRVNLLLSLLYLLTAGAFAQISLGVLGIDLFPGMAPGLLFMLLCGGLVAGFSIKMLIIMTSGFIFDQPRAATEYTFSIFLYNQMAALLLIPILAGLLYISAIDPYVLVITGIGLLTAFYLFRLFRVVSGSLATPTVSGYYLFLYLCTLEILPAAMAVKFIVG
ncbi:MAG: DUF4271 domain-containing protein [Bacteroidia bacterium]|nr:DUF4271 domain-containing protein [Bacteroidia bacterium]